MSACEDPEWPTDWPLSACAWKVHTEHNNSMSCRAVKREKVVIMWPLCRQHRTRTTVPISTSKRKDGVTTQKGTTLWRTTEWRQYIDLGKLLPIEVWKVMLFYDESRIVINRTISG